MELNKKKRLKAPFLSKKASFRSFLTHHEFHVIMQYLPVLLLALGLPLVYDAVCSISFTNQNTTHANNRKLIKIVRKLP